MTEAKPAHPGSTEVWITGIGLATSLGEGLDANWEALNARRINVDEKGRRVDAPLVIFQWQQGVPVTVYPQGPGSAQPRWAMK